MVASLPRPVAEYLVRLQEERSFTGLDDFHRRQQSQLLHRRTLYRWQRRYAGTFVVFPSFSVEGLGLVHVHLFIVQPSRSWSGFPYAIEQTWTTPDLARRVLYLHCIVPAAHLALVERLVGNLEAQGWSTGHVWLPSESGWQEVDLVAGSGHRGREAPDTPDQFRDDVILLHEYPLVVPAMLETWNVQSSLPRLWERVRDRLGTGVKGYFPRRRVHLVNGKSDLREAYARLSTAGLFRQQVVRGKLLASGNVEIFLVMRSTADRILEFIEACRAFARSIESYPCPRGRWLLRLTGTADLLNAIIGALADLPGVCLRGFFADQHTTDGDRSVARFCYEFLFNPKTGTWVFPQDRIMDYMASR